MNNPLISIIVNCHNGSKYLRQSLNSIFNQDYKKWEIIFVDNNSSDNSLKIVKGYDQRKIRIYFLNKKISLYKARNYALSKCKGEYISFLDTDDFWLDSKLSSQVELIKKKKYDIVYSNYYIKNYNFPYFKYILSNKILKSGHITEELLANYNVGILTLIFNKKKILENDKISFKEQYDSIADFDFVLRCSTNNKIGAIQKPLAIYGRHNNNLSKVIINKQFSDLVNWKKDTDTINFFSKYNNFKLINKRIQYMKIQNDIKKNYSIIKKIYIVISHNNLIEVIKLLIHLVLPERIIKLLRR